ncbi:MAG: hypothetical protein K8L97_23250 [Anaerolineae bacterium]|nr:hypothetical protein [Anaerolineae bacterium]
MIDISRILIEAMAKHLPPSGTALRLLDVDGRAGLILSELRGDLDIFLSPGRADVWQIASESADAVVAYGCSLETRLLKSALNALRPGGRIIILNPDGTADETLVQTLERAGYTRVLVESTNPSGVLMRGEKPHTETRTIDRIKQNAGRDESGKRPSRYVYLLIRQTPNKPIWALTADDKIEWQAVAVTGDDETVVLAFSSLPKAVEFMQPAVLSGSVKDVNKVAKFRWEVVKDWPHAFLLNPSDEIVDTNTITLLPVDPHSAEAPDE